MAELVDELQMKVAISCRILGMLGLVRDTTGHVSARIPGTDEMWIRCRGGDEYGLVFTDTHQIRRVNFDGEGPGMDSAHAAPAETPIHGEIYRAHPEVMSVVHSHPPYALRMGVTDLKFIPVFNAYDPGQLQIVTKGVPIFERSVGVVNKDLANSMLESMGDRDVLIMRGHGTVVTGSTVEAATQQAIRFDQLAKVMWELQATGLPLMQIPEQDMPRPQNPGGAPVQRMSWAGLDGVEIWGWKNYVRMLEVNNIGLPDEPYKR